MSIGILILGDSGSGKSTSLRNLRPDDCRLIKCIDKALPFENQHGWSTRDKDHPKGNVIFTNNPGNVQAFMKGTKKPIVLVDDFQATMTDEFFRRHAEKGYDKFNEIGFDSYSILKMSNQLGEVGADGSFIDLHQRCYIFAHTDENETTGTVKMKTIGKMVNDKMTPESYFIIVLRALYQNGHYYFQTHTTGKDPVKSPMGMFDADYIDNDLAAVDKRVCEFFKIPTAGA